MRRPKVTTRWLMMAVLGIGLLLGFGLPAAEVFRAKERHPHIYIEVDDTGPRCQLDANRDSPFWPRYRLRLLGRPWKGQPVCGKGLGRLEETCSIQEEVDIIYSCFDGSAMLAVPTDAMERKIQAMKDQSPDPRSEARVTLSR